MLQKKYLGEVGEHPRIANALLRRVRDYAQVKGDGIDY
jgi:Holliday junction resolvasome RuvABC ATP-dependent DNA helicase subunit